MVKRAAVPVGALLTFSLFVALITVAALGTDKIARGTTVAGVGIGGLDRTTAIALLNVELADHQDQPLVLRGPMKPTRLTPADLGLSLDIEQTVDSVAPSRFSPGGVIQRFRMGGAVRPVIDVDRSRFSEKLLEVTANSTQSASEPMITYNGVVPQVTEGRPGTIVDQNAAQLAIEAALVQPDGPIDLPMITEAPTVSNRAARALVNTHASQAVSGPIALLAGGTTVTANPAEIAAVLSYRVVEGQLIPIVDPTKLRSVLAEELSAVERPAKDASWRVGSGKPVIRPSKTGERLPDKGVISQAITSVLGKSNGERALTIPLQVTEPELTTEQAQALGITEKMSSFTQPFDAAPYRTQNIGLAGKKMNNTLLKPGKKFSLNRIVGERTPANGFTKGWIIGDGGKLTQDFGGGVSASATAVWTAAFFAGLERVEQRAHSIYISRYRAGLEATIAWGFLDLKFRNNTDSGVLITTKNTSTSMKVTIWGTKQFDKIKAESGPRRNITRYGTETGSGPNCTPLSGTDGFDITVDRVFILGGKEVDREKFVTSYIPAPVVRCLS